MGRDGGRWCEGVGAPEAASMEQDTGALRPSRKVGRARGGGGTGSGESSLHHTISHIAKYDMVGVHFCVRYNGQQIDEL